MAGRVIHRIASVACLAVCFGLTALWLGTRSFGKAIEHISVNQKYGGYSSLGVGMTCDGEIYFAQQSVAGGGAEFADAATNLWHYMLEDNIFQSGGAVSDSPGWHLFWTKFDNIDLGDVGVMPTKLNLKAGGFHVGRIDCPVPTSVGIVVNVGEFWIGAPAWFVASAVAAPLIFSLPRRLRQRRRRRRGCCPKCGYDLRASLDRCQECGAPSMTSLSE